MATLLEVGPQVAVIDLSRPADDPLAREIVASPAWNRMGTKLPAEGYVTVSPLVGAVAGHEAWFASVTEGPHLGGPSTWFVRVDGELRVLLGGDLVTSLDDEGYHRRFTGLYACKADVYGELERWIATPTEDVGSVWRASCVDLAPPLAAAAWADPAGRLAGLGRLVGLLVAVEANATQVTTEPLKKVSAPHWNLVGKPPKARELSLEGDRVVGHALAGGWGGGDQLYGVDADVVPGGAFSVTLDYVGNLQVYFE